MTAVLEHDARERPGGALRALVRDTPRRITFLTAALAVLAVLLGLAYGLGLSRDSASLGNLSARTTEVDKTSDLYYSLNDMDAQAADALLVGYHPADVSIVPAAVDAAASKVNYDVDRKAADADLATIAGNPLLTAEAATLLDDLGVYEADIAQSLYIDESTQTPQQPAAPPADALSLYVTASRLLHDHMLPAADKITQQDDGAVESAYSGDHGAMSGFGWAVFAAALLLIAALLLGNRHYSRRFHRRLSTLIPAAAVALILGVLGLTTQLSEANHLHVAKQDAYDSIYALQQARAVSDDANADESRWLLEGRDPALQTSFFTNASAVAAVPGYAASTGTPSGYAGGLSAAVAKLELDTSDNSVSDVAIGGFLGTELGNVTFPNEAKDAFAAAKAFNVYIQDDETLRADAQNGDVSAAVAFDIGEAKGESNYDFGQYTNALGQVIGVNQGAFDTAVSQGRAGLGTSTWIEMILGMLVLLVLIAQAGYLRLREYR
jgi:hypothetical protein